MSRNKIIIKSLTGYGNAELKKKEIKQYIKVNPFNKVWLISNQKNNIQRRCLLKTILEIKKWKMISNKKKNTHGRCLLKIILEIKKREMISNKKRIPTVDAC